MIGAILQAARYIKTLFTAHPAAVKGSLNTGEIGRSLLTALGSSAVLGVLIAILGAVQSQVVVAIPNPIEASIVSYVLVQVIDVLHRLQQGQDPTHAVAETFQVKAQWPAPQ